MSDMLDELKATIQSKIDEITSDSRYNRDGKSCANIHTNAPLALMQMGWESEVTRMKWVLNQIETLRSRAPAGENR